MNVEEKEDGNVDKGNIVEEKVDCPVVGMLFDTLLQLSEYYNTYAAQEGFAVLQRSTRKVEGIVKYVTFACCREGETRLKSSNPVKPHPITKTDCPARINAILSINGKWQVSKVELSHNHVKSPSNARFFRCNRQMKSSVKRRLELNDTAGIRLHKSFNAFVVEAGGAEELSFSEKDCRNYIEKVRRLRIQEGDAAAMLKYFSHMQGNNPKFFYAVDVDDDNRLLNIFWADERSRAAYEEFGDAITFDTTYLTNKYDMPFAPFVGVNHHGQSILLGCGLLAHEDTKSFTWLFETWLACMGGKAPNGIITDQDPAMKIAIQIVFPDSRHRWCLWHIMKKLPEKLRGYDGYESISSAVQIAVYNSLTPDEFDESWTAILDKFHLHDNEWLSSLHTERHRWVPAFVKDSFWAGMSTTQRSESMNAFFDGYVNSKTTLKQFVEQYENALKNKVEKEKIANAKSCNSCIPCISVYRMEKKIQSVYTNAKFREFQREISGKINCHVASMEEEDGNLVAAVAEDEDLGGRMRTKNFTVTLKRTECVVNCNCRLFEFRGILCRHAISVLIQNKMYDIPDKYILRRWRKDIKRRHTKVKVSYDDWRTQPEGQRYDKMTTTFFDIADIASDSNDDYKLVMTRLIALMDELQVIDKERQLSESNPTTPTSNVYRSSSSNAASCEDSPNILAPLVRRKRGRPPTQRLASMAEIMRKRTRMNKKKDAPYVTPQFVGYGFPHQQCAGGFMGNEVGAYGFRHELMPSFMPRPNMTTPQINLVHPNSFVVMEADSGCPTINHPRPHIMPIFGYNEYQRSTEPDVNQLSLLSQTSSNSFEGLAHAANEK